MKSCEIIIYCLSDRFMFDFQYGSACLITRTDLHFMVYTSYVG